MLRVRVVLTDATGLATPIPRLTILVSDNPPIDEPRRVRTTADGSRRAEAPARQLHRRTGRTGRVPRQGVHVDADRRGDRRPRRPCSTSPSATPRRRDRARLSADSATLLTAWRDSVVEIWTPTTHASGFVIDARRGPDRHEPPRDRRRRPPSKCSSPPAKERFKVPGRVILSERETGAGDRLDQSAGAGATRAIDLGCAAADRGRRSHYKDVVSTITASMFANKEVERRRRDAGTTTQAIFSDLRIGGDSEGGPVFAAERRAARHQRDRRRRGEPAPVERRVDRAGGTACGTVADAIEEDRRARRRLPRRVCRSSRSLPPCSVSRAGCAGAGAAHNPGRSRDTCRPPTSTSRC